MKNKNGIKAHNNQEVGVDPAHQAIDNLVAIVTDLKAFKEIVKVRIVDQGHNPKTDQGHHKKVGLDH